MSRNPLVCWANNGMVFDHTFELARVLTYAACIDSLLRGIMLMYIYITVMLIIWHNLHVGLNTDQGGDLTKNQH